MTEYPQARGYGEPYGYGEPGGGYMSSSGYGGLIRHGGHHRLGHGYLPRGRMVDYGEYGRYGRYGVDSGEYGRYGRYDQAGGCVVDSGEYGRHGGYGQSGGSILDSSDYYGPHQTGYIHQSPQYVESSSYMTNASPYAAGMANAAVSVPPVVSPTFCVPYVTQFVIEEKVHSLSSGKFVILDTQGRFLFEVENKFFGIHTKRILCDAKGVPLVLLKKMNLTLHDRWEAYRGEDSHDSNLLFVMKKSAIYQTKPSFDIFLSANTALSKPDFTLKGDFHQHNYTIFFHHTPIAEASRKMTMQSAVTGTDKYGVTVFPGVDHAFIAALIVIVDQIKQDDTGSSKLK